MDSIRSVKSYQGFYLAHYGFEAHLVQARQRLILELLSRQKPRRVLEIGCGPVLLYDQVCQKRIPVKQWVIVDPCQEFLKRARPRTIPLTVFPGFFEKEINGIRALLPAGFDFVICSGMLNEVRHPVAFLKLVKQVLSAKGRLHINVPNAGSLHRRLGVAMGLAKRTAQASHRNRQLMQYHVFDQRLLTETVAKSGFVVESSGGYFLKPFSHEQMHRIGPILSPRVLDGLWQLGREHPDLATEIYINLRVRR